MSPWLRFAGSRLAQLIVLIWAVMTVLFILLHAAGSPAQTLSGPNATAESIAATTKRLGLDKPIWHQYLGYVGNGARLNFGDSYASGASAFDADWGALPATLRIILPAMVLIVIVGVGVGLFAALRPRSRVRSLLELAVFSVQAIPFFWLAILLVLLLAIKAHVFPATGSTGFAAIVLPAIVLACPQIAAVARLVRGEVSDALVQPYAVTALSKGMGTGRLLVRHIARNVLPTLVSFLAVIFAFALGAVIIVEPLFNYSGIGALLVTSVRLNDYPVVEAGVLLIAVLVAAANIVADALARLTAGTGGRAV